MSTKKKFSFHPAFVKFLKDMAEDENENIANSDKVLDETLTKMAITGAFGLLKTIADNGESVMKTQLKVPTEAIRIYLNAVVNICVILEKALVKCDKMALESMQKIVEEESPSSAQTPPEGPLKEQPGPISIDDMLKRFKLN